MIKPRIQLLSGMLESLLSQKYFSHSQRSPQQSRGKSRLVVEKQTPSHSSSQIWNTYQGKKDMPLWFLPKMENRNEQIIVHVRSQSRCPYPAIIQNMASCSCSSLCMSLKSKHSMSASVVGDPNFHAHSHQCKRSWCLLSNMVPSLETCGPFGSPRKGTQVLLGLQDLPFTHLGTSRSLLP